MTRIRCPYLERVIELSDERALHIVEQHPELAPDCRGRIAGTLENPDMVRRSERSAHALLFSLWHEEVLGGKHVVVVVVTEPTSPPRCWIVTAYVARKLTGGSVEWKRN